MATELTRGAGELIDNEQSCSEKLGNLSEPALQARAILIWGVIVNVMNVSDPSISSFYDLITLKLLLVLKRCDATLTCAAAAKLLA